MYILREEQRIEHILSLSYGLDARLLTVENIQAISALKLKEIHSQAEKDGRLVVLPCKPGSTAFILDRAEIPQEMRLQVPDIRFVCLDDDNFCRVLCDGKGTKLCAYRIKNDGTDIGKTIFMTRKEAEAALEQRKGEQHDD